MTRPVLVLRPEPGAARTVARLQAKGVSARAMPLFAMEPRLWTLPEGSAATALAVTSANAVRHAGDGLHRISPLPLFAVGRATAEAASAAGLVPVWAGEGDAQDVAAALATAGHSQFYHLCGHDHVSLGAGAIPLVTYEAVPVPPPNTLLLALREPMVILVHSPAAARHLAALVDERGVGRSHLSIAAISVNAAAAAGKGWQEVAIAAKKDDEALTDLAARLSSLKSG